MSLITYPSHNAQFNPVDFYKFAGDLYKNQQYDNNEVVYRTVIGRAYYSAFLCAKTHFNIKNTSGSVHNEVIAYAKEKNKTLGLQLIDLKALRHKADYQLNETVQRHEAIQSLRLAKTILITLNYSL